jgi:hypothetical protein
MGGAVQHPGLLARRPEARGLPCHREQAPVRVQAAAPAAHPGTPPPRGAQHQPQLPPPPVLLRVPRDGQPPVAVQLVGVGGGGLRAGPEPPPDHGQEQPGERGGRVRGSGQPGPALWRAWTARGRPDPEGPAGEDSRHCSPGESAGSCGFPRPALPRLARFVLLPCAGTVLIGRPVILASSCCRWQPGLLVGRPPLFLWPPGCLPAVPNCAVPPVGPALGSRPPVLPFSRCLSRRTTPSSRCCLPRPWPSWEPRW